MDDIVNIVYSDKNLSKLSEKISSVMTDMDDSQSARDACKLWLKKKMKNVIELNIVFSGELFAFIVNPSIENIVMRKYANINTIVKSET